MRKILLVGTVAALGLSSFAVAPASAQMIGSCPGCALGAMLVGALRAASMPYGYRPARPAYPTYPAYAGYGGYGAYGSRPTVQFWCRRVYTNGTIVITPGACQQTITIR